MLADRMGLRRATCRPIRRRFPLRALLLAGAVALGATRESVGQREESAPPPQAAPFFFIQMSDPQFGMWAGDSSFERETADFERAIAAANRLRPAFVIVTGDLVNRPADQAQIAEYKRIAGMLDPRIPLYNVPGNHDVENAPTAASIIAYEREFGFSYYSFRAGNLAGIVLNSSLIHSPQGSPAMLGGQELWLDVALQRARTEGVRHIVIFQHHPWFLERADEPDQYFNIPLERRARYLALFRERGVRYLFSGHYHRNALAAAEGLEMITTGPVGRPLGDGTSGLRIAIVTDGEITHRWYDLDEIPEEVVLPRESHR